uniref:Hydroxycinnamoyl-coenzyme A: quinate hydroxycinnamoyl transferase n=1 Tax=Echinacea purpurea TaxID=53751 RepID=A0A890VUL0_ECHPU|nr:hydroxycinnamoyl-coenzyme A: quinate hydroxycinnamoyl transferase [Echinacea purpurea]
MNITITKSSLIPPSETLPGSETRLWTSNLDLVVGRIHILTVYFYRPNGSSNFFDPNAMKQALADVLVSFYPMAGRLGRDESGRVVINCNGEGALFVEAEADSCLDDFGEFTPSPELRSLTPAVDYSGDVSSYPLFFAQVTHFKCGGVSLGCGVFHTLSDGLSSLHFINTWSDVARGLSVAIPPFIDRTLLRAREPPTPTHDHVEYHPPPTMTMLNTIQKPGPLSKSSTTMLKLTLDQLNTLKAKTKTEGGPSYSTYEILAAHIWRCACKARGLPDDQLTKLYVATDGRSRLSPHLPRGYLGNVVFTATPVATSGALTSDSLQNAAKLIHTTLTQMDNEYLRSAIDYLEIQPDLSALIRGPSYFASPNLNINAWSRLPVHDADFGWGRPVFMGPAIILYEGTVYVLPSPNNDRSVSLAVCLDAKEQPLFEKYLYEF